MRLGLHYFQSARVDARGSPQHLRALGLGGERVVRGSVRLLVALHIALVALPVLLVQIRDLPTRLVGFTLDVGGELLGRKFDSCTVSLVLNLHSNKLLQGLERHGQLLMLLALSVDDGWRKLVVLIVLGWQNFAVATEDAIRFVGVNLGQ